MAAPVHRNLTGFMQRIRNFLLQREMINPLRFSDELSPRDQPPPILPDGISHKIANNYYYIRDGRRESRPSTVVWPSQNLLAATGPTASKDSVPAPTTPTVKSGFATPGAGTDPEAGTPLGPSPYEFIYTRK